MNFDKAFDLLISHEGGLSMLRSDPGNWTGGRVGSGVLKGTKYGIAANTYPSEDIKNLTLARAKQLYKRDFWDKVKGDQLPAALAFHVFDMAVNSGVSRGAKILQKTVGVNQDGLIGPATLKAVSAMNTHDAILIYNAYRLTFYTSLSTFGTFGKGWTNRVANNLKLAGLN